MSYFGDIFYNRLPEFYRNADKDLETPYQLKKFLNILGGGFDSLYDDIKLTSKNFDVDDANPYVLDSQIKMLGFTFPYEMSDNDKRNLIKVLPTLYQNKGNAKVFE